VVLIGESKLDINRVERPKEYADDQTCDLFLERPPKAIEYGRTYVAPGEHFDFDSFKGGELIIEDYRGEKVPTGRYDIAFWEPSYEVLERSAVVNDKDRDRLTQGTLTRTTQPLDVETTGSRKPHRLLLTGNTTGYKTEIPLNFSRLEQ